MALSAVHDPVGETRAREPVQALWIGDRLTPVELLSIRSFLANGHPFHLYAYRRFEEAPEGTVQLDASEILPEAEVLPYQIGPGKGSFSLGSNHFRYVLLLERGGTWVDMDVVCLRPFDFEEEYVFLSEERPGKSPPTVVNGAVIRVPPGSEVMRWCLEEYRRMDPRRMQWGDSGPFLLSRAVPHAGLERYVQPPLVLSPISWMEARQMVQPSLSWDLSERVGRRSRSCTPGEERLEAPPEVRAIHLYNETWRRLGIDKLAPAPTGCLVDLLARRYP
jgi:hypothetical protein